MTKDSTAQKKNVKKHEENIGITVKKSEDVAEWYQQVCLRGELAEHAPVKGCMIIKPNGYAIWEGIQDYFNNILISDPDCIRDPSKYGRSELQLRAVLVGELEGLESYSEYVAGVVTRYNSPHRDYEGNLHSTQDPVSLDDFIGDENIEAVRELDRIIVSMKELGNSPEKLDSQHLLNLMYQASLFIYGKSSEEKLRKDRLFLVTKTFSAIGRYRIWLVWPPLLGCRWRRFGRHRRRHPVRGLLCNLRT